RLRHKHHYDSGIDYWEAPFYDKMTATLSYFSARIADSLASGDITTAARFAGTMAHFFEDNAVPAHAMDDTDLEIVKDLFPPPPEMRSFPFHSEMERDPALFDLGGYVPEVLGTSAAEIAFLFTDRIINTVLFARSRMLDFFKAFYDGDDARIAELNAEICVYSAKVYADYIHTVTSLAFERFDAPTSSVPITSRSLSKVYPYRQTAWAGGGYNQTAPFDLVGRNLDASFTPVSATLKHADGTVLECPDSLCATAHYEYEFRIPKGVYKAISFYYGLNSKMISHFSIVFEVSVGGGEVIFREEKALSDFAGSASLEIPKNADLLRFTTTLDDAVDVPKVNGRPIVETGHAVWGSPHLKK
ncbi:MAG: hypothetical protein KAG97_12510, partial [Victivallales bacterium]|nr:hypothetical protein [Victivallales bacterium]